MKQTVKKVDKRSKAYRDSHKATVYKKVPDTAVAEYTSSVDPVSKQPSLYSQVKELQECSKVQGDLIGDLLLRITNLETKVG